ncbi:TrpB-like pyridoxal phosphate-dependent enzyme [Nocardioides sp. JQ2195]|uniref:TrpB-like pyridoxal phosphate-dependent enzyme n=1 Tax=Nocardioides sp. JQ2195 TaxID=2592334 RepID=UPI00143EC118|nr:TrpB-like pyridoxal phosphate-dependent enzyme [Nocardioides sp. JQ2195]QIX28462.1 TrpB-like pyridoxal phosphate-dependent enzyme [Nocardioides sp. JQ2195]
MSEPRKFLLDESEMPTHWYNIVADLPTPPPPPLHPGTHQPVGPDDLAALFPPELIAQEVSAERFIEIPEPVREVYAQYRPSPLIRARTLEQKLGTPARIYYKYEGVSPAGSHKVNTSVPQAYYNKINGIDRLTTETGAGQWGTALSYACSLFDMTCEVWQVGASYDTKPQRRTLIEVFGGKVHRSPSRMTESGRAFEEGHPGSLGIAISEAVELAAQDPNAKYALGSVLNHVLLHQTISGEETLRQLAKAGESGADLVVGCAGGGSNFAGLAFPFLREKLAGNQDPRILAVEPTSCPTLTRGEYRYDFGDTAGLTPLMKMYTLGHDFVPSTIHAGGLRYHGMAPLVSHAVHEGLIEATALHQGECFEAAVEFARTEGVVPAPESSHALAQARREALEAKESGEEKVIVILLSGHGLLELGAYDSFLSGRLEDDPLSEDALSAALAGVPVVAGS